jgi:hypothetical protein
MPIAIAWVCALAVLTWAAPSSPSPGAAPVPPSRGADARRHHHRLGSCHPHLGRTFVTQDSTIVAWAAPSPPSPGPHSRRLPLRGDKSDIPHPAHHHAARAHLRSLPVTTRPPHFVPRSPLTIAALRTAGLVHIYAGWSPASCCSIQLGLLLSIHVPNLVYS